MTEFQKPDKNEEPWYMCFLCQCRIPWKSILDHITSVQHRLDYMVSRNGCKCAQKRLKSACQTGHIVGFVMLWLISIIIAVDKMFGWKCLGSRMVSATDHKYLNSNP